MMLIKGPTRLASDSSLCSSPPLCSTARAPSEAQPRKRRPFIHRHEQAAQRGADPLAPTGLATVRLSRERPAFDDGLFEGRGNAVVAVRKQLIEGPARDARATDHVFNGHLRVADLTDRIDHRGNQA